MKCEQLASGSYRVKPMINGKRYSLTFDHIPTDKEINAALMKKIADAPVTSHKAHSRLPFADAVKDYIELKIDRNSPSTTREYERLTHHFSDYFCGLDVRSIQQLDVDKEIASWLKKDLSYKTMLNYFKMMQTVIKKFGGATFSMDMLPEKPKKDEPYIPTNEDIYKLLTYLKEHNSKMLIPIWLGTYGLRRGEVCALDPQEDIDFMDAIVHIRKDMVEDIDHNWVVKEPKTQASKRDVPINPDLADLIRITDWKYTGHPNSINKALQRAQKKLGIEQFSLHKLRHYCCSELFDMGCTETDVMYFLGWEEESECMRQVYKHSRLKTDQERQRDIANKLSERITKVSTKVSTK